MAKIPFTLRIEAREREALKNLSKIEGRPINQLLNEAIRSYLSQRGQREQALEASLTSLRTYREKDAGFRQAIAAFVEAEATVKDPVEGESIEGEGGEDLQKTAGPVQSSLREVIGA